jgi:DNA-directed RNA polymerase specialized sigma24 family protein
MEVMVHGDHGDATETLYDAHAPRLYAYCWSLVGDEAPEALKDTFIAATRLGPARGDELLWLYALARAACLRRDALGRVHSDARHADPLRQAAACLRSDHREVLLLSAGLWLKAPDIARLVGVAPDTVGQLIQAARTRLERAVLDALMHRPTTDRHDDIIAAFEQGRLPTLLARRVPAEPPAGLRADVLTAVTRALPAETGPLQVTTPGSAPLVVLDAQRDHKADGTARRRVKGAAEISAIAAAAATAAGLFVAWGGAGDQPGGGGLAAPQTGGGVGNPLGTPLSPSGGPHTGPAAPTSTPFTSDVTGVPETAPSHRPGPTAGAPTSPLTNGGSSVPSGTSPSQSGDESAAANPAPTQPSSPSPSRPSLGDTLGDTVGGTVGGVGHLIGGGLGDTLGGVGDTVGGTLKGTTNRTTSTVGNTVGTVQTTATGTAGAVGHISSDTLGGTAGSTATNAVGTVTNTVGGLLS